MKKLPAIKPTIPDRLVSYFNPVKGANRMRARLTMAMVGGYSGASKKRRTMSEWRVSGGDADSDIIPDLPTLRERSRDLVRNNPIAAGAMNTKVGNIVGTGLRLQSTIDGDFLGLTADQVTAWQANTEREFKLWSESEDCDAARTLNFYAQQDLVLQSAMENGDVFVLLPFVDRPGAPYNLVTQIIEADRVCNDKRQSDTKNLSGGIERDDNGAPIKYHILRHHPGNLVRGAANYEWDIIDAYGERTGRKNILHLYRKRRPGQTRGVPDLAPVIEPLRQLGDYTDAELTAAVISGMFTVFVKSEGGTGGLGPMEPTGETGGKASDKDLKLASGAIIDLSTNESIETANPGRPNAVFDPFVMAILTQVGIALELPVEVLMMKFAASYSASKAAIEQAWVFYRNRRKWLVDKYCKPVYREWMNEAVAIGRISAPGYLRDPAVRAAYLGSDWIGPAKPILDLTREAGGRAVMEDRGWITAATNTTEMTGGDWDQNHKQRSREHKMRVDEGLEPGTKTIEVTPNNDNEDD